VTKLTILILKAVFNTTPVGVPNTVTGTILGYFWLVISSCFHVFMHIPRRKTLDKDPSNGGC
jgi:hypothetical protein